MSEVRFGGNLRTLVLVLAGLTVVMIITHCATAEPPPRMPGPPVTTDGKPAPPEAFKLPRHSILLRSARSGKPALEKMRQGGKPAEPSR